MAQVILKSVTKRYVGNPEETVKETNLEIADREFMILVGPSGCGKSTTLRMIAGLEEVTSGQIYIGDRLVNDVHPKDRDIAMVFQNYALYPHMTVFENLAFGLTLRDVQRTEIDRRVADVSVILGLKELLERKPKALSGGQRQRVALGRAIVREPKVFLMDEPLSNLDAKLRVQMRAEINKLHQRLNTTVISVTHDQTEAMTMGDRITVLHGGYVQQCDTPQAVYDRPANKFVAGFIGSPSMNFATCRVKAGVLEASGMNLHLPKPRLNKLMNCEGLEVDLGFRPEHVYAKTACPVGVNADSSISATIDVVEPMGSENYVYFKVGDGTFIARMPPSVFVKYGASMDIVIDTAKVHLFERPSGRSIPLD
ncbi:MAG: sn-glycerol-3-phosphate ABC transporter ATP-binding protein UgpC [Candidatus Riflebacteria bacterium]|nr:sn-glycerol-3-phosphate ABC transporter ATP-binding protein UgpC [Candidatus Riflebacteria bacterium]